MSNAWSIKKERKKQFKYRSTKNFIKYFNRTYLWEHFEDISHWFSSQTTLNSLGQSSWKLDYTFYYTHWFFLSTSNIFFCASIFYFRFAINISLAVLLHSRVEVALGAKPLAMAHNLVHHYSYHSTLYSI